MKLNPDCVRDLMLALEETTGITLDHLYRFIGVNCRSLASRFKGVYDEGEIAYTLIQLAESNYIKMSFQCDGNHLTVDMGNILYVTPKGHEFISQIQDKECWSNKIKPAVRKFGNVSLAILEAISKGISKAAIDRLTQY